MKTTKKELIETARTLIKDAVFLLNTAKICENPKACKLKITIYCKDRCLTPDDNLDKLIEFYKGNNERMDIYDKRIDTLLKRSPGKFE